MVSSRSVMLWVLCAAWLPIARGQDVAGAVWTPPDPPLAPAARDGDLDGAGSVVHPPQPESDDLGRDPERPINQEDVDVRLELPTFRWLPRVGNGADFLHQVSLQRLPPGSLQFRYKGFHEVLVRNVRRHMKKLWREYLRDAWEAEAMDFDQRVAEYTKMYEAMTDLDAGGRWWERSWMDSLMPEHGGAPFRPLVQDIGQTTEFLDLGPLALTTDARVHVSGFAALRLDPDVGQIHRDFDDVRLAREHAHLKRDDKDDPDELPAIIPSSRDASDPLEPLVRITLEPPDPGLSRGYWRLRFRPQASFHLSTDIDPTKMIKQVSLRVTLELFMGAKRMKFMQVEGLVQYDPDDRAAAVGIEFALVTW